MIWLPVVILFVLGVAFGSFLNVLVLRTHAGVTIRGRSKCMQCETPLGVKDLIPIVSYIALRGRCRTCKTHISWQYPLVELTLGAIFAISWLVHANGLIFGLFDAELFTLIFRDAAFGAILLTLFVYDLKYQLLPDKFTIPGIALALVVNLFLGVSIVSMLYGAMIAGGFFFAQFWFSKGRWIGGGDVRLGVLMGVMLGFESTLVALFLAYLVGAIVSVILLVRGKVDMKSAIPFGVFLTYATLVALFAGDTIINWYVGFLL